MEYITILGSTGTIGQQTLDVISQHPERYAVFALTAHQNVDAMLQQCVRYQPQYAVMQDADSAQRLRQRLESENFTVEVLSGIEGLIAVSSHESVNVVMAAIVGAAGLLPALAAAKAGKKILLANKETLVMAGQLFMDAVKQGQATLLPIDSEHNAIFQALPSQAYDDLADVGVNQIILTASGGPFRCYTHAQLAEVTPALALKASKLGHGRKNHC